MPDPLSSSNHGNVCFHFHINGCESQPLLRNRLSFQNSHDNDACKENHFDNTGFAFHVCYTLQFGPTPGRRDDELRGRMARRSQLQKDLHHVTFPRAFPYVIPLNVMALAYLKIARELQKCVRKRKTPTATWHTALKLSQEREGKRVVRMLIVVTVLFATRILPNNIIWLWLDFGDGEDYRYFWDMVAVSNLISLSFSQNSAAKFNPIAYTICHENFRDQFRRCLTCNSKTTKPDQERTFKSTKSSFSRDKPRSPLMQVAILPVCRPSS